MTARLLLAAALLLAGCSSDEGTRDCSFVDCASGVDARLSSPDGTWAAGTYSVRVTVGDQVETCSLAVTGPLPAQDAALTPCGATVSAGFVSEKSCPATSEPCSPIPGRHRLQIALAATPEVFEVQIRRDDEVLVEGAVPPAYAEADFGDCGTCRFAVVTLTGQATP
jgi:hypothetical protein